MLENVSESEKEKSSEDNKKTSHCDREYTSQTPVTENILVRAVVRIEIGAKRLQALAPFPTRNI